MGTFCLIWSQEACWSWLVGGGGGAFGNSYKGPQSISEVTLVLGSMSVTLGKDSTSSVMYFSVSGLFFLLLVAHKLVRYPRLGCKNKAKSGVSGEVLSWRWYCMLLSTILSSGILGLSLPQVNLTEYDYLTTTGSILPIHM